MITRVRDDEEGLARKRRLTFRELIEEINRDNSYKTNHIELRDRRERRVKQTSQKTGLI
jgi:hypothetical protein